MITLLRKAFIRHGYLIIIAAWLYTISFIVHNYWNNNSTPQKVQKRLADYLVEREKTFEQLSTDTALLRSLADISINTTQEHSQLTALPFGIFIYQLNDVGNPLLSYWNNNKIYINAGDLQRPDGYYYVNYLNGSFEYIKKTVLLHNGKQAVVAAMLPVHWDYFTHNKYLQPHFDGFEELERLYEITTDNNGLPVKNSKGQELFRIKQKENASYIAYNTGTVVLRTIAMILLLFFINVMAKEIVRQRSFKTGFAFLSITVVALRLLTYVVPFPFDYTALQLFDPSIYASNAIHPSLGHLLVNTVLFFWLVDFYKFNKKEHHAIAKPMAYVNIVLLTLLLLVIAGIIRSLILDSQISFDVTHFFSLNVYTLISFCILCFLALSFFYLSHILMSYVYKAGIPLPLQLLTASVSGLLVLTVSINSTNATNVIVLLWMVVYLTALYYRQKDIRYPLLRSPFLIFWVMFFAASFAILVVHEKTQLDMNQRKKLAEKLSTQTDPYSENLLYIAASNISDSFLTNNFFRFQAEYHNKTIKDSILSQNFSGYLNKYETRIYTFDSLQHPIHNDDSATYASIRTDILNKGVPVDQVPGLYSYKNTDEKFSYIYEKVIPRGKDTLGFLFVKVTPKRYKSEALYPELFKHDEDISSYEFNSGTYYAVYYQNVMVSHFNDYPFPIRLDNSISLHTNPTTIHKNGYSELWYKNTSNGTIVVIVKKTTWRIELISLFAYLFCSFLLLIALFNAGSYLLDTRFRITAIRRNLQLSIRSQIQSTILFISIFSFIIIGISTISFFIYRFKQNNEARLSNFIQVMANDIEEKANTVYAQLQFDDVLTFNSIGVMSELERKINELSDVYNVDVNLYKENGELIASTQPYIYNKHLLSTHMEPTAFNELHYKKQLRYIQSENIANLPFLSIYVPITNEDGTTYAYLNIPYLNSQTEVNQEISSFLATLISVNAFVFLLAGAIAFLITNRITASFSIISQKMKEVNLGKENEEIIWSKEDEIGILVTEYNKMVRKLEDSARALAQSEREGAWREMARQVAHEIKNPLTPMKLSIQYLQRAIDSNSDNVKELSQRVAATLVEQIEQLSRIAGDFSQFANISNIQPEVFDISETLESLINLHRINDNIRIEWNKQPGNYTVLADKTQMNRLFTNLIKNAIEATADKDFTQLTISQKIADNHIEIGITDNGTGIPQEMQHKIFTPNFTTKSSGTGLGLAICKGITEKANGHIWFNTQEGQGTTFYVSFPQVI